MIDIIYNWWTFGLSLIIVFPFAGLMGGFAIDDSKTPLLYFSIAFIISGIIFGVIAWLVFPFTAFIAICSIIAFIKNRLFK